MVFAVVVVHVQGVLDAGVLGGGIARLRVPFAVIPIFEEPVLRRLVVIGVDGHHEIDVGACRHADGGHAELDVVALVQVAYADILGARRCHGINHFVPRSAAAGGDISHAGGG